MRVIRINTLDPSNTLHFCLAAYADGQDDLLQALLVQSADARAAVLALEPAGSVTATQYRNSASGGRPIAEAQDWARAIEAGLAAKAAAAEILAGMGLGPDSP